MLVLTGCVSKPGVGVVSLEGCYKADISFQGNNNIMTICFVDQNSISIAMYFPNNTSSNVPTTCREKGVVKIIKDGFLVQGELGECENGRQSAPYVFPCEKSNLKEFKCTIEEIGQVITFVKNT